MQPTNLQVKRSLEALELGATPVLVADPILADPGGSDDDTDLCSVVAAGLGSDPVIRADRLEEARQRLADGFHPTADDLADRMVGRLVCDRLR